MRRARTNKKYERGVFVNVSTKVSPMEKEMLESIARFLGLSLYEMLRLLLRLLIRRYNPILNKANVMDDIITDMENIINDETSNK